MTCIGRECEFLALTPDTSEVRRKVAVALYPTNINTINLPQDEPSTCHVDVCFTLFSQHKMLEQDV